MTKVSIIIPTLNEEKCLPKLLNSIHEQDFEDYEIIIADFDSQDRTREIAKDNGCLIVEGGLPGVGRNNGVELAKGEILIFLDSDLILTENYLRNTVEEFESGNLGIGIGQMIPLSDRKFDKLIHWLCNKFMIFFEKIKPHGAGCYSIIAKKSLHDEIGGFDENLDFGEDTDYIEKIGKISKFRVLRESKVFVSIRRLEKEGFMDLAYKYSKSTIYDFMGKKVSADEIDYKFGYESKEFRSKNQRKRILYSVCGEGLGHAMRVSAILEEINDEYDIIVFTSERAYDYLSEKFDNVYRIYGFNTVYKDNKVKDISTFISCMRSFPYDLVYNFKLMKKIINDFEPNIMISDFECYISWMSNIFNIPLISLDNVQSLSYCKIDYNKRYFLSKIKASLVVRVYIIRPKVRIIISYFCSKFKDTENIVSYPPVLRKEIMALKPSYSDYILVYQTSTSNDKLLKIMKLFDENFIVYGFDIDKIDDNLVFKKFNEDEFFNDIKNAKAVITNGGFTLISEALYLRKPIFSIPVEGQFEQTLNAIYVEKLGYGLFEKEICMDNLTNFIKNIPIYQEKLEDYEQKNNNSVVIKKLKEYIELYSK